MKILYTYLLTILILTNSISAKTNILSIKGDKIVTSVISKKGKSIFLITVNLKNEILNFITYPNETNYGVAYIAKDEVFPKGGLILFKRLDEKLLIEEAFIIEDLKLRSSTAQELEIIKNKNKNIIK